MIVLGITGSIGMGKSTASCMMERLGVPVINSDKMVHDLMKRGGAAVLEVAQKFPQSFNQHENEIDRKILGKIVFNDSAKKKELEDILYPKLNEMRASLMKGYAQKGFQMVALDVPLLYETGKENLCDYVIVVSAPYDVQKARVLARPGMNEDSFEARLKNQMPDAEKKARADFVVDTGRGYYSTFRQLKNIVRQLQKI